MLEICVDSLDSAYSAISGGASRLELCNALSEGGLTPTPGLAKQVKYISNSVPIYTMLRIRGGDFVYSREEMDAMLDDLELLRNIGVDGFVFGALTKDGNLDTKFCKEVVKKAHPLPVTFHRAFDDTLGDPVEVLENIIGLGFERILTSGQKSTAEKGIKLISKLVEVANGRIVIMPGAGITVDNLKEIQDKSQAKEFHASAKKAVEKESTLMSERIRFFYNMAFVTDKDIVRKMVETLKMEES